VFPGDAVKADEILEGAENQGLVPSLTLMEDLRTALGRNQRRSEVLEGWTIGGVLEGGRGGGRGKKGVWG
jgi:hypothetical protein